MRDNRSGYGRLLGLLLLLCIMLISSARPAEALTVDDVQRGVETWVRHVTADARPDARVALMEPYLMNSEVVAYIAHLEGGGFCLAGADKMVLPVYLYMPSNTYDPNIIDFQNVLYEIGTRLQYLRTVRKSNDPITASYNDELAERETFWQSLINGAPPGYTPAAPTAEPTLMELNVTSHWHQGSPFNDYCPDMSGTRTVVGCGATATAQVMRYWRWPDSGSGSASVTYTWRDTAIWLEEPLATDPGIPANWGGGNRLEWTSANGGRLRMNGMWDISVYYSASDINSDSTYHTVLWTLYNRLTAHSQVYSANFAAATYSWNILQDTHTDPPDTGDLEAAELSHHVGIAINMDYGIWGSRSSTSMVAPELASHFDYDSDGIYVLRHAASVDELTAEIQWLRPVVIRGSGPGIHIWVLFGYNKATDPNRQFKMNLGWGGGSDGWYTLDSIAFHNNEYYVRYLAPENVVQFVGGSTGGDGSPADPYVDVAAAVAGAPVGAKLIFKAGTVNTFSSPSLTINTPMTLHGKDAIIKPAGTP